MKEEETWQGDDWEFGRPSEEPSHTQTHNCSQSCANELAVTTHLGGYQHALIELADALTRHRCSTSLPQCHNAGRGSRGAQPRSRLPCQKANRERPQPPNFRNRTMGSFLATYSHSAPGAFTQRHARLCRAKSRGACGFPLPGFSRVSLGFAVVFIWFSLGFPLVLPWFSFGSRTAENQRKTKRKPEKN